MTKYICECLDGARKCTHETSGFSAPTVCCVRANATCHWRKVENQEGEAPAPIIPEWCREGAWVHVTPDNREPFYGKVFAFGCSGVMITLDGKTVIGAFFMDRIKKARIRPWNDDELKSKVGKVFEMGNGDLTLCLGYQRDRGALYFAEKGPFIYPAKTLAESDWKLDGSPCGVLEHKNEQGEWVK